MPAALLGEVRRVHFNEACDRFREQMAVAEPRQCTLQSGAVIVQRHRDVLLLAFVKAITERAGASV